MKLELRNKITLEKDGHKVIFEMYKESDYLGTKGDNKTDLFDLISEEIPGKKSRTVVLIYRQIWNRKKNAILQKRIKLSRN